MDLGWLVGVLVIFLERMHDVVFAYECLRASNIKLPDCQVEDCQALRAWCGAKSVVDGSVLHLFGGRGSQYFLILSL